MDTRFVSDGVRTKCLRQRSGQPRLDFLGCVLVDADDDVHRAGEFWTDRRTSLWYYCEQLGNAGLRLNFGGCVTPDGDRVGKETENVRRGVIYKCFSPPTTADNATTTEQVTSAVGLLPVGCVYWGKRYALGQVFHDGHVWYTCEANEDNSAAIRRPQGCIYKTNRIAFGQRYVDKRVMFECTVSYR